MLKQSKGLFHKCTKMQNLYQYHLMLSKCWHISYMKEIAKLQGEIWVNWFMQKCLRWCIFYVYAVYVIFIRGINQALWKDPSVSIYCVESKLMKSRTITCKMAILDDHILICWRWPSYSNIFCIVANIQTKKQNSGILFEIYLKEVSTHTKIYLYRNSCSFV